MSGKCLEGAWKVSKKFLEGVWILSGWYLEGIWEVSERCLEGVCDRSRSRLIRDMFKSRWCRSKKEILWTTIFFGPKIFEPKCF